jgi:hypothetical protein
MRFRHCLSPDGTAECSANEDQPSLRDLSLGTFQPNVENVGLFSDVPLGQDGDGVSLQIQRCTCGRKPSQCSDGVDFADGYVHIRFMDFDISQLLDHWEYQPGQVVVRKFKAKDGQEKIQLRVDLGLLQMNADGRPDGKRPFGHTSLLEYHQARLYKHLAAHDGNDDRFILKPEECAKLQLEALQYHHRYICLLQLEDYAGVVRDAERNLAVFDFVEKHAESEELAWSLRQFQPQLLMILTRARGAQALKSDDYTQAFRLIDEGLEQIRAFYREHANAEAAEQSSEILSLEDWLEEIRARRPLSQRERLERALSEAVKSENYEKAAKVRDELRNLKSTET